MINWEKNNHENNDNDKIYKETGSSISESYKSCS